MMKKMIDKRTILLVVMIFTIATTGIFISKLLSNVEAEVDRNEEIKVFKEALTIVRKNYVKEVQPKDLINSAIKGMIGTLNPHSDSMTPGQYKEVQADTTGILISKLLSNVEAEVDRNEEAKVFKEALTIVRKNYAEEAQPDIQSKDLIYGAIKGMIGSLDPHSSFMTPEQYREIQDDTKGEFGGIGIQTGIKEEMLTVIASIEDTPAFRSGVKAGDKIIKVNDEFTKDMTLQEAASKLRGASSTKVKITILREGLKEKKDFTITREIIKIKSVKSKMLKDGIGYIKINLFQAKTASELSDALSKLMQENMNSLVLDLRNNPGGLLYSAVNVAGQFMPSGKLVVYTKDQRGEKKEYLTGKNNPYLTIPIVVIVNEASASASEIAAGALKDWHRATIIGMPTFGKGSVQSVVPLNDGSALRLTTAMYYTPKGVSIQATGILPDIVVKPKIKEGQQVRPVIREKDLEGHLTNGQNGKQTDESKEIVPITVDEKQDVQLQRAIDILKNKTFKIANPNTLGNDLAKVMIDRAENHELAITFNIRSKNV